MAVLINRFFFVLTAVSANVCPELERAVSANVCPELEGAVSNRGCQMRQGRVIFDTHFLGQRRLCYVDCGLQSHACRFNVTFSDYYSSVVVLVLTRSAQMGGRSNRCVKLRRVVRNLRHALLYSGGLGARDYETLALCLG